MAGLTKELTENDYDDFFSFKKVTVDVQMPAKTWGKLLDPNTGESAEFHYEPYVPPYKRKDRNDWDQKSYAVKVCHEEEKRLFDEFRDDRSTVYGARSERSMTTLSSKMEKLEVESAISGVTTIQLPAGLSEEQANEVYKKYSFDQRTKYDPNLSITRYAPDIIHYIESQQVVVIQGETGSGKTTQVPQYLLDHYAHRNKYCNIVVTQPRRIAAQSICARVCQERNWKMGNICGYQIGLDRMACEDTRLLFCTTEILLQKLIHTGDMRGYTHVVLDEVHERDRDSDLLLLVVRKLLRKNSKDTKVILMSATLESQLFARYFSVPIRGHLEPAPVLNIQGRTYSVQEYYLDDLESLGNPPARDESKEPRASLELMQLATRLIEQFDNIEQQSMHSRGAVQMDRGSVLMFLPGLPEIQQMMRVLREYDATSELRLMLVPLHSTLSGDEQYRVFHRASPGQRKVVLATNIAESSITVPDIKYVVDFCLTKCEMTDPETGYSSLQTLWASKANCTQRKGRAGRVSDGRVYRLVYSDFYNQPEPIRAQGTPEMERCPLHQLILKAKTFNMGTPKEILGTALSPPAEADIERSVLTLKEVGALIEQEGPDPDPYDGRLTFMGKVLTDLPLDMHLGKLILLGHVFGLLEECIIIAATLSVRNVFSSPFDSNDKLTVFRKKLEWAQGSSSDLIAYLHAYKAWKTKCINEEFKIAPYKETQFCRDTGLQRNRLMDVNTCIEEVTKRLVRSNICKPRLPEGRRITNPDEDELVLKMVFCGAFYPSYFIQAPLNEVEAHRTMAGFNPLTTVMIRGVPPKQGILYRQDIQRMFMKCDSRNQAPKVYCEETRAFVEFPRDLSASPSMRVVPAVYVALQMRKEKIPLVLNLLPDDVAKRRLKTLTSAQTKDYQQFGGGMTACSQTVLDDNPHVNLPPAHQTVIKVFVTEVADGAHFWGHYGDQETHKLMHTMLLRINVQEKKNFAPLPPSDAIVGKMCLAPFKDDHEETPKYYRARIERITKAQGLHQADVVFVDYGNDCRMDVTQLKVIDPELLKEKFQAMEFELAHIKPSPVKCPHGRWSQEAKAAFGGMVTNNGNLVAEIFSVVHGVLRVELYEKVDRLQVHINKKMVDLGYADLTEESYISMQDHEDRIKRSLELTDNSLDSKPSIMSDRLILPSVSDLAETAKRSQQGRARIQGPVHAYEMNFSPMSNVGGTRVVVVNEGINSVAIDDQPQDRHQRIMVCVGEPRLNPSATSLLARNTTLMPKIHGLPALAALLFCPMAEFRTEPECTRYTGALCGLGYEKETGGSLLPEHDMEVTFDTSFDQADLIDINGLRSAVGMALGPNKSRIADLGPDLLLRIQSTCRDKLLKLLQRRRPSVVPYYFKKSYYWCQLHPDLVLVPVDNEDTALYTLHNGVALLPEDDPNDDPFSSPMSPAERRDKMRKHNKTLHELAGTGISLEPEDIHCRLCEVATSNARQLFMHLSTIAHKQKEAELL